MKRTTGLLLCAAVLYGCAASFTAVSEGTVGATLILSDPPGARIEINDDYIGETPLYVKFSTGTTHGRFIDAMIVRALPIGAGQYTQTKNLYGKKAPRKMLFDMGLKPVPNELDVNVNQ